MSEDKDTRTAEGDEACEASINMITRAIASLGLVPQHRRIVDAERSLQIAKTRLEDYLGK